MNTVPQLKNRLVAHRGWPARYPENSVTGVRAVLAAGARHVEFDVQLSAEREAVIVHDDDLGRLTGRSLRVTDMPLNQLSILRDRKGNSLNIPTLSQMLAEFDNHPEATAFIELKRESIARFGRGAAVDAVIEGMARARCRCVIISFDGRAAALARRSGIDAVGWVFRSWSSLTRMRALWLRPDYLFVRSDRVPTRSRPFWPGPWQWVVYGVAGLDEVDRWHRGGADLVEVDDLPGVLAAANKSPLDEQL